jgi:hypothetical protein
MRIVSLLPSATELLHTLDAVPLLVGRSHECDVPRPGAPAGDHLSALPVLTQQAAAFTSAADVDRRVSDALASGSSLYNLDVDRLHDLAPDLILTQDLCEVCSVDLAQVRRAAAQFSPEPAVLSFDPQTFEDVLDDLVRLGDAVGRPDAASRALVALRERVDRAAALVAPFDQPQRVLFLEWTDPPFAGGHWTPQLIERAGGEHPLNPTRPVDTPDTVRDADGSRRPAGPLQAERVAGKSPRLRPVDIVAHDRRYGFDRIFICPCGLSLADTEREARRLLAGDDEADPDATGWFASLRAAAPLAAGGDVTISTDPADVAAAPVVIVDGNLMFNRPGPRLVDAFEFLVAALQGRPGAMPPVFPAAAILPG